MIKYTDFFELIDNGGNLPIAALFMTYGFDAELFEHHILPSFLGIVDNPRENELRFRNQIALKLKEIPVGVISDAKQFNGGRTFLYDHITVQSETFHPKCYMLLFKEYLRVIISSGNITKSGLCYNAELVWYEDIYLYKSNSISAELQYILSFMKERYSLYNMPALQVISEYLDKCEFIKAYPNIISTCSDETVFTKVISELKNCKGNCKNIIIISPFFENDREKEMESTLLMSFINSIKTIYPKTKINISFPAKEQGDKYIVNAPIGIFNEVTKKYKDINLFVVPREWIREGADPIPRTLHAKLIYAQFDNGYNLYLSGSVNFTNNAMNSSKSNLRNIEIGVLNYTKQKLILPNIIKVSMSQLKFIGQEETIKQPTCFIDKAEYNGTDLKILFNFNKVIVPCKIYYNDRLLLSIDNKIEEKIINNFILKKPQDLKVECNDFVFYVPIIIPNKEDIITDDLKLNFEFGMNDIIDYLAGKYKSISELERMKRIVGNEKQDRNDEILIFFRQNLQRFYKALVALKQGLELPYYSETAFDNYITAPIGIKNLVNMIIEDYKEGRSDECETFLFLVEILNIIDHLNFHDDWLDDSYKKDELDKIMYEAKMTIKSIVKKSRGKVKEQYEVMINVYGLEV